MYNAVNNSDKQKSIGGRVLYPGESRPISKDEIAEALGKGLMVPGYEKPAPVVLKPVEPVLTGAAAVQKLSIEKMKPALLGLKDEEILELEELERKAELPRETVFKIIEKEIVRRAEEAAKLLQGNQGDNTK